MTWLNACWGGGLVLVASLGLMACKTSGQGGPGLNHVDDETSSDDPSKDDQEECGGICEDPPEARVRIQWADQDPLENVPTSVSIQGVIASAGTAFSIDTCPPGAECDESTIQTFLVDVPGLLVAIPDGTFVSVEFRQNVNVVDSPDPSLEISIRNLPLWQGQQNPTSSDEALWLFATTDQSDLLGWSAQTDEVCMSEDADPVAAYTLYDVDLDSGAQDAPTTASLGAVATTTVNAGPDAGTYAVVNVFALCDYDFCYTHYGVSRSVASN